jgi:hypothetical protein
LWQQHRTEIAARRLILSARAAHTEGDHQRADKLLYDARQLDPRMRTLWDGSLSVQPPSQSVRKAPGRGIAAPQISDTVSTDQTAATARRAQHRQPTTRRPERAPQPAWPSAPARSEPHHPAPASVQPDTTQGLTTQGLAQRSASATAWRERRTSQSVTTEDPDTDADTRDGSARWPSPNPRSGARAEPRTRQAEEDIGADTSAGIAGGGIFSPAAPDAGPSADWRDDIITAARETAAREPWRNGPSWPHHPAMHRSPETPSPDRPSPDTGIEAGR